MTRLIRYGYSPTRLIRDTNHVPDGDAAFCSGTLYLGEIHPQLLGLLLGRIRRVRLLLASARGLLGRLLSLLGSLIHRVIEALILGCLVYRVLELHVGVDHLLDLGLRISIGELLSVLLQLGAVLLEQG